MSAQHHRHSLALHYPHTLAGRTWEFIALPALILMALFIGLEAAGTAHVQIAGISLWDLLQATMLTVARIAFAYLCALVCAVPLSLLATYSRIAEKFLLPLFDILQSVPVLAFFPILVLLFINIGFINGAAIFILFITMLWSITFALIGGIGLVPKEITYAAEVFGIRGSTYLRRILLPALIPQAVVGSILAIAQGWNIIIVAEVIRTYLPANSPVENLHGLGSMLVYAAANGQNGVFLAALASAVLVIALVNFFIWQNLLKYAQRFKFE